jgi:hypothetical protein
MPKLPKNKNGKVLLHLGGWSIRKWIIASGIADRIEELRCFDEIEKFYKSSD